MIQHYEKLASVEFLNRNFNIGMGSQERNEEVSEDAPGKRRNQTNSQMPTHSSSVHLGVADCKIEAFQESSSTCGEPPASHRQPHARGISFEK